MKENPFVLGIHPRPYSKEAIKRDTPANTGNKATSYFFGDWSTSPTKVLALDRSDRGTDCTSISAAVLGRVNTRNNTNKKNNNNQNR